MSGPRPPLHPDKVRRARLLVIIVTGAFLVGSVVDATSGRGLWAWGLVGWAAIVAAVALGAGLDNAVTVLGLTAPVRRLRTRVSAPDGRSNDADWN